MTNFLAKNPLQEARALVAACVAAQLSARKS
jgi:hypothetical protein